MTFHSNYFKKIEDFVCDFVDEATNDGVLCTKELDTSVVPSRAVRITQGFNDLSDQGTLQGCSVTVSGLHRKRSDAVNVIGTLHNKIPHAYSDAKDGFAIRLNWVYSTSPSKLMVGTLSAYIFSVNLRCIFTVKRGN